MKTTPTIEDQFAIQNLLYRYADASDRRDAASLIACFADGQTRITGPGIEVNDGNEMIQMLSEMFDWTMHNVHNFAFEVEDDRAHGYTYCVASHVKADSGSRTKSDMYIRYVDELIKKDSKWLFVKRELNIGLNDVSTLIE